MSAVASRCHRAVAHEIISVVITCISVLVFIITFLALIGPHVGGKVRVVKAYPFINYSDNNGRVSCREVPCILHIDVGSGNGSRGDSLASCIYVMPLVGKRRIIEWCICGS